MTGKSNDKKSRWCEHNIDEFIKEVMTNEDKIDLIICIMSEDLNSEQRQEIIETFMEDAREVVNGRPFGGNHSEDLDPFDIADDEVKRRKEDEAIERDENKKQDGRIGWVDGDASE